MAYFLGHPVYSTCKANSFRTTSQLTHSADRT